MYSTVSRSREYHRVTITEANAIDRVGVRPYFPHALARLDVPHSHCAVSAAQRVQGLGFRA